jgi:hypothetical protein
MHVITAAFLAIGPPGIPVQHPQTHCARSIFELVPGSFGSAWVSCW